VVQEASDSAEPSASLPPVTHPEYVRSRDVTLKITPPAAATHVVLSSSADFDAPKTVAVSAEGTYEWRLAPGDTPGGRGSVYVRFVGDGVDPKRTISTEVLVDDAAPTFKKAAYVDEWRAKGRRTRVWISVAAQDSPAGVKYMQFAVDRAKPKPWFLFTGTVTLGTGGTFVWVRTADGAGNVSGWRKVAFPAKPKLHPRR
jgi:hypothetical protein